MTAVVIGLVIGLVAVCIFMAGYCWGYADARFDTRHGITGHPTPMSDCTPRTKRRACPGCGAIGPEVSP